MKTMKWLITRELWGNKGSLFWAPLVVGGLITLFVSFTASYGIMSDRLFHNGQHVNFTEINGVRVDPAVAYESLTPAARDTLAQAIAGSYMGLSIPVLLVMVGVVFFYCLGALHEERRDRSILFWKSLPLSDEATVLSKVLTAIVVAPLISLFIATVCSIVLLIGFVGLLALKGVNLIGLLAATPALYLMPLTILALLPIYILWAVGVPLMIAVALQWSNLFSANGIDTRWFVSNILVRGLGGLVPGIWLAVDHVDTHLLLHAGSSTISMSGLLLQSYMLLARPQLWIGVIAGVAMLYGAVRLRRWRDEG